MPAYGFVFGSGTDAGYQPACRVCYGCWELVASRQDSTYYRLWIHYATSHHISAHTDVWMGRPSSSSLDALRRHMGRGLVSLLRPVQHDRVEHW